MSVMDEIDALTAQGMESALHRLNRIRIDDLGESPLEPHEMTTDERKQIVDRAADFAANPEWLRGCSVGKTLLPTIGEPWIQSTSGRKLLPFALQADSVTVEDIAHHLSQICRFNGACRGVYSVAEHAVRMSYEVPREHALAALHHDDGEYVLGDIPRPMKSRMAVWDPVGQEYHSVKLVEERTHRVICRALGISSEIPPCVHAADLRMVVTEARDLMTPSPEPWQIDAKPYGWHIFQPWSTDLAAQRFLWRHRELTQGEE